MPGLHIIETPVARAVPFDNSTNSFVATNVQAAIEEATHRLVYNEVTSTSAATTTSGTDALLTSMTYTPAAGTYLCLFNTDININAAGAAVTILFHAGGSGVAASQRKVSHFDGGTLSAGSARGSVSLQSIITVNGSQAIEVFWSTSGGTATAANRSLITMQVSP